MNNITGVTILDSTDIYVLANWQLFIGFAPLVLAVIILFVRMHKAFKMGTEDEQARSVISNENWSPKELLTLIIGAILSLILIIVLSKYYPSGYLETRYEIKIDDSASFNEVYDKYIIIEEKEDTFIVKEK